MTKFQRKIKRRVYTFLYMCIKILMHMTFRICDGAFSLMTHSNRKYFLDARLENEWVFSHTLSYQSQECFFLTRKNMSGVPAPQVSIPIILTEYSKEVCFCYWVVIKVCLFLFYSLGLWGKKREQHTWWQLFLSHHLQGNWTWKKLFRKSLASHLWLSCLEPFFF